MSGAFSWSWAGLSWSGAALGAALLCGLVVVLYLLQVERRILPVAFLELWKQGQGSAQATRLRSRVRHLLSLLLQLLILVLLLLALGDFRRTSEDPGRSLVVLLDVSASMAREEAGATRLQRAQAEVRRVLTSLRAEDQMLLVAVGARPRPLTSFTADRAKMGAALDQAQTLDTEAQWEPALQLAQSVLQGQPEPYLLIVSDGEGSPGAWEEALRGAQLRASTPLRVDYHDVRQVEAAEPAPLLLSAFAVRDYPLERGRFEVLAELRHLEETGAALGAQLSVFSWDLARSASKLLELQRFTLGPGEILPVVLRDLAGAEGVLEARLELLEEGRAAPHAPQVAWAVLPSRPVTRVLLVTEGNPFLEAALLVDERVQFQVLPPALYPPAESFDVVLFDGVFPPRVSATGAALYLGAPEEKNQAHAPLTWSRQLTQVGFDQWERKHPLFHQLDPYDVQVLQAVALTPQPGDQVLGKSDEGALLVTGERPEGRFLALGFDLRQSDFVLRAEFPLFLSHAVAFLAPPVVTSELSAWSTGTLWRFPVEPAEQKQVQLRGPEGQNPSSWWAPVEAGRGLFWGERAGIYQVGEEGSQQALAANFFSLTEGRSPVLPLWQELQEREKHWVVREVQERQPWWVWLLLAAASLSLVEWWTYHRRWTV